MPTDSLNTEVVVENTDTACLCPLVGQDGYFGRISLKQDENTSGMEEMKSDIM